VNRVKKSSRASGARRSWPGSLAVGRVHGTQKRARASASRGRGRVECPLGPRVPPPVACALVCTPTAAPPIRPRLASTDVVAPTQKLDGLVVGGQTRSPSLHVREILGLRRTREGNYCMHAVGRRSMMLAVQSSRPVTLTLCALL
jgi:hypothetical protein